MDQKQFSELKPGDKIKHVYIDIKYVITQVVENGVIGVCTRLVSEDEITRYRSDQPLSIGSIVRIDSDTTIRAYIVTDFGPNGKLVCTSSNCLYNSIEWNKLYE